MYKFINVDIYTHTHIFVWHTVAANDKLTAWCRPQVKRHLPEKQVPSGGAPRCQPSGHGRADDEIIGCSGC